MNHNRTSVLLSRCHSFSILAIALIYLAVVKLATHPLCSLCACTMISFLINNFTSSNPLLTYLPFPLIFFLHHLPSSMAPISPSPDHPQLHHQPPSPPPPPSSQASVDLNITVIIAAMLCALVCALGLHSMLQCVFQCTQRALTEPRQWVISRRLNSGLKKKEMVALPIATYANPGSSTSSPSSSGSAAGCAICLVDFINGDEIRLLPRCNHRFHVACIDKWLLSHSSCPTCRHRLKSNDAMPSLDNIVTS